MHNTTTMNEKLRSAKKKSKKGFTLIELVIVIAILSILASLAIPTISTMISSARLSAMESDSATLEMLINECITTSLSGIKSTLYGENGVTASNATIKDICYSSKLESKKFPIDGEDGKNFFCRSFGDTTYQMVFCDHSLYIKGSDTLPEGSCIELNADTPVTQLAKAR